MAACAPAAPAADKLVIHDKYLVGKKCDQRLLWEEVQDIHIIYIYMYIFVYVCKGILPARISGRFYLADCADFTRYTP